MEIKDKLPEKAKNAKRESKYIDFKERFDLGSSRDWCEIIKDIVAMANSGGGVILIGVRNNGVPSGYDISLVLNIDPAKFTDKIASYTGIQFSEFEIEEIDRDRYKIAMLQIHAVPVPIVFVNPGTYDIGSGKQETAFSRGTVYFRHGAKSEPGTSTDLGEVIKRELERTRKSWFRDIRKVIKAPTGYNVHVLPPDVRVSTASTATPIRIVDEKDVPAYRLETPDITHPYRQKEIIQIFNKRLEGRIAINPYDVLCVRRIHKIDETKPQYYYRSKYGAAQYSEDFLNWLVECYEDNPNFFTEARGKI